MKILLINNFHYRKGGSEAVYFNTAEILREHGHEVIFFSTQDSNNHSCAQSEYFTPQNSEVSKIKGIANYFYNVDAKQRLEKLIIAEKPDIAHVHLIWGGISPSIFSVLKKHRVPLVHTAHDYRMICPAYAFKTPDGKICEQCSGKYFYKCTLNKCSKGSLLQSAVMTTEMYVRNMFLNPVKNIDGFIFVSKFSRDKHMQFANGFTDRNSMVLYNMAIDEDLEVVDRSTEKYFLFFGRLSHEKGIHTLIKAFGKMPDSRLLIVGTGPEEDILKQIVKENSYRNIEFAGYKSGDELRSIIRNASFVIVPSEWYENNPMTIVEAYALGVPVIGSRIGGIPEIIEEGGTGWTFIPKEIDDLCAVILKAESLPLSQYQSMSRNAKKFADDNFNKDVYYNRLMDFYKNIIDDSNK